MIRARLPFVVLVAACGPKPESRDPQPTAVGGVDAAVTADATPIVAAAPPPDAAPDAPPAPAVPVGPVAPTIFKTATGDLDGKPGNETIQLYSDGRIVVGDQSIAAPFWTGDDPDYLASSVQLRVIALHARKRVNAVVLVTPTEGVVDPPARHRLFVLRKGALVKILDEVVATPRTGLRFPGDGTARYDESAWTACGAAGGGPVTVPIREIILAPHGKSGMMNRQKRGKVVRHLDCDQLAACPYVYRFDGAEPPQRLGEILRWVRGAKAYTLQSLAVPGRASGTVHLRIAEEKPETTYLDEVFLEVDGERIAPRACSASPAPRYCAADRTMHVLREGDSLDLVFDLDAPGSTVELFARGYYVPR